MVVSFSARVVAGGELRSEVGVVGLRGQGIGPVEGEVEMAAAIVEFAGLTGGGFVFVEELADGVVHRFGKHERFGVVGLRAEVFEGDGDGEEFTERIPPQMVLGVELLTCLGAEPPRRSRTNRRRRAAARWKASWRWCQFQNRKQVGEIIAQHVAGDGH